MDRWPGKVEPDSGKQRLTPLAGNGVFVAVLRSIRKTVAEQQGDAWRDALFFCLWRSAVLASAKHAAGADTQQQL